jgi:glutathione S-transferase
VDRAQLSPSKVVATDPWQELKALSLMSWCSSGIHPFLARINSPTKVCESPNAADSVRRLAPAQLVENFQIADNLLAGREFFFDHFTAPDAHFFWCMRRKTVRGGPCFLQALRGAFRSHERKAARAKTARVRKVSLG